MKLARKVLPELGTSSSLAATCDLLKVPYPKEDSHRAAEDTRLLSLVWFALLELIHLRHPDIRTLRDLLRFSGALAEGQCQRTLTKLISEARTRDAVTTAISTSLATGLYSCALSDTELLVAVRKACATANRGVLPCLLRGKEDNPGHRLVTVAGTCVSMSNQQLYSIHPPPTHCRHEAFSVEVYQHARLCCVCLNWQTDRLRVS